MTTNVLQPTLVNGRYADKLQTTDRGLLYGDGVFETIAIREGRPRYWTHHIMRLRAGCDRLGIPPVDEQLIANETGELTDNIRHGVLKLIVTRGSGGRGYRMPDVCAPVRILQLHPWPSHVDSCAESGVAVRICTTRLGRNPVLAGIKHLNRLEQVLARNEWHDTEIMEGLMTDTADNLIEGTMSNLFLVRDRNLYTPDLSACGVAGVMRSVVLELAATAGLEGTVCRLGTDDLDAADEIFLTNSLIGIWPVIDVAGRAYRKGTVTSQLQGLLAAHTRDSGAWRV